MGVLVSYGRAPLLHQKNECRCDAPCCDNKELLFCAEKAQNVTSILYYYSIKIYIRKEYNIFSCIVLFSFSFSL